MMIQSFSALPTNISIAQPFGAKKEIKGSEALALIRQGKWRDLTTNRETALNLKDTETTDADLAGLSRNFPGLITLHLDGTQVTDTGLDHLLDLRNLETLTATRTKVTLNGVKKLQVTRNSGGLKVTYS